MVISVIFLSAFAHGVGGPSDNSIAGYIECLQDIGDKEAYDYRAI